MEGSIDKPSADSNGVPRSELESVEEVAKSYLEGPKKGDEDPLDFEVNVEEPEEVVEAAEEIRQKAEMTIESEPNHAASDDAEPEISLQVVEDEVSSDLTDETERIKTELLEEIEHQMKGSVIDFKSFEDCLLAKVIVENDQSIPSLYLVLQKKDGDLLVFGGKHADKLDKTTIGNAFKTINSAERFEQMSIEAEETLKKDDIDEVSSEDMEALVNFISSEGKHETVDDATINDSNVPDNQDAVVPEEKLSEEQEGYVNGLKEEIEAMDGRIEKCKFLQNSLLAKVIMPISSYAKESGLKIEKLPENIDPTEEHVFLVLKMGGSGHLSFFDGQNAHKIDAEELESIYQSLNEVIEFFQKNEQFEDKK